MVLIAEFPCTSERFCICVGVYSKIYHFFVYIIFFFFNFKYLSFSQTVCVTTFLAFSVDKLIINPTAKESIQRNKIQGPSSLAVF